MRTPAFPTTAEHAERQPLLASSLSQPSPRSSDDAEEDCRSVSENADACRPRVRRRELVAKVGAASFDFFTNGIGMGAVGVLISHIEQYYNINDSNVAFIFPAGMIGYLIATALVSKVHARFGSRGVAVISPALRVLAALVLLAGAAFPVTLAGYVCLGLGNGMTDTAWNAWASATSYPSIVQGFLHGSFSLGCVLGPLVAIATLKQYLWQVVYGWLGILSFLEIIIQGYAFRHDGPPEKEHSPNIAEAPKEQSLLQTRHLWVCGAFLTIYQGVEASFTDWFVVFMQRVQHVESTRAALAPSAFWIGMTIGRYLLGSITERFGVRRCITVYIVLAIGVESCLLLVRPPLATLMLLVVNGSFLAPIYPSAIVLLVSRVTSTEHVKAVAIVIAAGQIGSAIVPLGVGFMATNFGMDYLLAIIIALSALMLLMWCLYARLK